MPRCRKITSHFLRESVTIKNIEEKHGIELRTGAQL
jgi:hypothetical protein